MARRAHPPDPAKIAAAFEAFRDGRNDGVTTVRGWAEAVVRGGNWRFADADGIIQDILLKLIKLAGAGKVRDPESFQKFVYRVAKNTCVTVYHRERSRSAYEEKVEEYEEPTERAQAAERLEQADRLALLAEILQRLPETCRRLWDWIYREHRKPDDVAAELGINPGTLRVRVHRCNERARTLYRDLQEGALP